VALATDFERLALPLAIPFGISRGTTETAENVLVRIEDEAGTVGVGAAAPSAYYGESVESALDALPELLVAVEDIDDPHAQQALAREMHERAPDQRAARAAVSVAVHDLAASQQGEPLYRRWGLDPDAAPQTTYTIGIASPEEMAERASAASAEGFPLKVKLGTDADRERVRAVREAAPDAHVRVDANGAWEPADAIAATRYLAEYDVALVEQPVPADDVTGLRAVREEGALPVAADESCVTATDVPQVGDAVDVVVVKVTKCGGLRSALRQIATAKAHGLETMIGCMVASNAAIAGAAHLAPLCEYADLDGSLLLADDPYAGVPMEGGTLDLRTVTAGTGARPE
jgi:L-alanine-DL-glutamate epimerase-like enolase superfamily enzyme